MKNGKLVIISGPSGVGKGTIIHKLLSMSDLPYVYSVSWTTRMKRKNEIDGKDYYFVTKEIFKKAIKKNEFLEYEEYVGNWYGTPRMFIEKSISQGKIVLLEIDTKGALKLINKKDLELVSIFLIAPTLKEYEKRLRKRGISEDLLIKRMKITKWELKNKKYFDYIITNNKVSDAVAQMRKIIEN